MWGTVRVIRTLSHRPAIAASGGTSQGHHRPSLAALNVGYWESSLCLCTVLLGLQSLFTGASLQGPDVGVIGTPESLVWLASAHRPCFLSAHRTSLLVLALPFFLGPQTELLAFLSFLPAPPSELCGPTTPFRGPLRSALIGASSCCGFLFCFVMGPGMEPGALHILGKCSSVKLCP